MNDLRLNSLYVYPVKSARGLSVMSAEVTERGLRNDRRWLVCDDEGSVLTQRQLPILARLQVSFGKNLALTFFDSQIKMPLLPGEVEYIKVEVWCDQCNAWSMGSKAKKWLSKVLGIDSQLVYMPDETYRPVDHGLYSEANSFADAYPFLIISLSSLNALNKRLDAPVSINRFRPNIVIEDCEEFAEDGWKVLRIGDVQFELVKACARCAVPGIDQTSGKRTKGVLEELSKFRRWDGHIWFGKNALARSVGEIRIGETVEILESD